VYSFEFIIVPANVYIMKTILCTRRAGGGSIINTASFVAILGAATPQLAYTASKGAVLSLSRELACVHGMWLLVFCCSFD
jgi:NAD(P)-dependent dehydrogenase (short-subunit alcohol dehydrogenase family)